MHNVTQNFLNTIKLSNRGFKSTIKIRDTIFDDTNIIDMSLEENVNPTDSFMLGSVASNKLEVTLIDVPNILILENAIVNPKLSLLVGSNYEEVPLGVFTVDEISKDKSTVKLTCFDNMIKLEKTYFSNLSYPASINSVAQEICSKAGVQLATTLPSTLINKIEGYTYREAISFIASFLGGFARFNRLGKLEIVSYGTTNVEVTGDNYFKLNTSEKAFTIGRLACQVGENIISVGASGNEIKFENPIMTQVQLNNIFNTLKTLSYMPYSMDWQGNPALMAGDKIKIIDVKGNTYNTLLMQQKLSYKGGLSSTSKAVGKTEQAQEFSSNGSMKNKVERVVIEQANIKLALIEKATIEDLTVVNARIDNLYTTDLKVVNAKITNLEVYKADVIKLNAETARINDLYAKKADIIDLTAISGKITLLETKVGSIDTVLSKNISTVELIANDVIAVKTTTAELNAGLANVNKLVVTKAEMADLLATNATISTLDTKVGTIDNLVNGNLTSANMKAGSIKAGDVIIADGAISNAQIINLDVSKINAGNISTNKFVVGSDSGNLQIKDNTLKVWDINRRERVSLGLNGADYNLLIRGIDGATVLFGTDGVTNAGITKGAVDNSKVADNANISGSKIEKESLVTTINGATTTLKSSRIKLDDVGQTLDIAFKNLSNIVTTTGNTVSSQGTSIKTVQGQITSKIWQTDIDASLSSTNTEIVNIKDKYTVQEQTISGFKTTIADTNTRLDTTNNNVLSVDNKVATINKTIDGITSNISSIKKDYVTNEDASATYTTNVKTNALEQSINGISSALTDVKNTTLTKEDASTTYTTNVKTNTLEQNINGFSTRVGNVETTTTAQGNTIASHTGSISAMDNAIKLKVDNQTFNTYKATTEGNISTINTSLNKNTASIDVLQKDIKLKVSQTEIDNSINTIEIGGRNLALLSSKTLSCDGDKNRLRYNLVADELIKNPGANVVISFEAKHSSEAVQRCSCYIWDPTTNIDGSSIVGISLSSEWKKFYICTSLLAPIVDVINPTFTLADNTKNASIRNIKVEIGNKATAWTAAPEDIDKAIEDSKTKAIAEANKVTEKAKAELNASINTINGAIANMSNDNILSKIDKSQIKKEWEIIFTEYPKLLAQANKYSISVTAYTNSYNALNTYIAPLLANMAVDTPIDGTVFRSNFKNYYDQKLVINNLLLDKAKADAIGSAEVDAKAKADKALADSKGYTNGQITTVDTKINTKVSEINLTLDGVATRVGKTESTSTLIDGKVTALSTRLSNAEQKITPEGIIGTVTSSTAYKTDMNGKASTTDLTNAQSSISQLSNKIENNISETSTIKGVVTNHTSSITQLTTDINSRVKTGEFETYKSQTATVIGQKVSNSEFGSLFKQNIDSFDFGFAGGTNLIKNGRFLFDSTSWTVESGMSIWVLPKEHQANLFGVDNQVMIDTKVSAVIYQWDVKVKGGNDYTISLDYNCYKNVRSAKIIIWWKSETGDFGRSNSQDFITNEQNCKMVYTVKAPAGTSWCVVMVQHNGPIILAGDARIRMANIMMVEGRNPSNWAPHPSEFNSTSVSITDADGLVVRNNAISVISKNGRKAFSVDDYGYIMNEWGVSTRVSPGTNIKLSNGIILADDKCSTLLRAFGVWHESVDDKYNMRIASKTEIWFKNLADEWQSTRCAWSYANQFRIDGGVSIRENCIDTAAASRRLWLNYGGGAPGSPTSTIVGDGVGGGYGELHCGAFYAHGSKNRAVETEHFGIRALGAYETPTPYFGDLSLEPMQVTNGICIVPIDPIFKETITATGEYQVFLSKYGEGDIWTAEMYPTYFIVKGANIKFSWELKAIQRGYENNRLEQVQI